MYAYLWIHRVINDHPLIMSTFENIVSYATHAYLEFYLLTNSWHIGKILHYLTLILVISFFTLEWLIYRLLKNYIYSVLLLSVITCILHLSKHFHSVSLILAYLHWQYLSFAKTFSRYHVNLVHSGPLPHSMFLYGIHVQHFIFQYYFMKSYRRSILVMLYIVIFKWLCLTKLINISIITWLFLNYLVIPYLFNIIQSSHVMYNSYISFKYDVHHLQFILSLQYFHYIWLKYQNINTCIFYKTSY